MRYLALIQILLQPRKACVIYIITDGGHGYPKAAMTVQSAYKIFTKTRIFTLIVVELLFDRKRGVNAVYVQTRMQRSRAEAGGSALRKARVRSFLHKTTARRIKHACKGKI